MRRADHGQLGRDVLAQRLERAQQQRQALALDRPGRRTRSAACRRDGAAPPAPHVLGVDVHAVGDHPVVAAEKAPPRPRGGLRDRDPDVQVVEHPPRAEHVGDPVGDSGSRSRSGTCRPAAAAPSRSRTQPASARPARGCGRRRSRRCAARGAGRGHPVRGDRQVRDRAVGLEADRAAQRHQVFGRFQRLRPGATVQHRRERVRRVVRRQHPDVVAVRDERSASASMCLVTPPGIRPRVRRQDRDPHVYIWYTLLNGERAFRSPRGGLRIIVAMPVRHFVKYTFLKVDPAWRRLERRARWGQARVHRRLRGLRRRPPAARVLAGRHAWRRRPDAAQPGPEPRADPRVPRRPGPERADEVVRRSRTRCWR